MKVLITGGCGFVGSNLAVLIKESYGDAEVICFDNLSRRGSEINLQKLITNGVKYIHGDVRTKSDFDRVSAVDIIIDAAAEPSVLAGVLPGELENLIDTNLNGTVNTLYFAKKHEAAIIFLSTSRVYPYDTLAKARIEVTPNRFVLANNQSMTGLSVEGVSEKYQLEGVRSFYGATKLCSEYLLQEFFEKYRLPVVINRCGVLSGPYQMGKIDQGVIVLWMAKHFWGGELKYIGYGGMGQQVRDVLHVRDLFRLIQWQISNLGLHYGQVFNVGGGSKNSISLSELTLLCSEISGIKLKIGSVSDNRLGDLPVYITDNRRITEFSGWRPEVDVPNLLVEIFNWINQDQSVLKKVLS